MTPSIHPNHFNQTGEKYIYYYFRASDLYVADISGTSSFSSSRQSCQPNTSLFGYPFNLLNISRLDISRESPGALGDCTARSH
ncbi:hypothetical protein [Cupriavidus basilensis]|uniref:hypothetical protein n=1 Tax=Cupriavidus basilensis TaxID=68895 RepID=UPI0023E85A83|nr:hypothetical protein [Cupriavidus basilensis]MDF3884623.1 hypothetical protein [Cupriavidus basilensis]